MINFNEYINISLRLDDTMKVFLAKVSISLVISIIPCVISYFIRRNKILNFTIPTLILFLDLYLKFSLNSNNDRTQRTMARLSEMYY